MKLSLLLFIILFGACALLLWSYYNKRTAWAPVGAAVAGVLGYITGIDAVGFIYASLAILALFMGYAAKESKKLLWGRPVAAICGVLIIILGLVKVIRSGAGIDQANERQRMNQVIADAGSRHDEVKFNEIGKMIGKSFRGTTAFVIVSPYANKDTLNLQISALEKGMESLVRLKKRETWSATGGNIGTEQSTVATVTYDAKMFDHFVKTNSDCTLIISLVGLPMDLQDMKFWDIDEEKRPKLVLVDSDIARYKELFEADLLHLAILQKPAAFIDIRDTAQLDDPEKYLADNYAAVTSKNWSEMYKNNGF